MHSEIPARRTGAKAGAFVLGILAYVLPTFPLGYFWHLAVFKGYYDSLAMYRDDVIIPFGLISMLIQGVVWSYLYWRLFASEPLLRGAAKFFAVATSLAWTFLVLAIAAKHRMASVSGFLLIETGFTLLQYVIVSPLMALAYARR